MTRITIYSVIAMPLTIIMLLGGVSSSLSATPEEAEKYLKEGVDLFYTTKFESALDRLEKGLIIYRDIGDQKGIGNCLYYIGIVYMNLGLTGDPEQYDKAVSYLREACVVFRDIGYKEGEGNALHEIGMSYFAMEKYSDAITFFQGALTIRRAIGDKAGVGYCLRYMGDGYWNLARFIEALACYEEATESLRDAGVKGELVSLLNRIGKAYSDMGRYDKALEYYIESSVVCHDLGDMRWEGAALYLTGETYGRLGRYDKALGYYMKALELRRAAGNIYEAASTLSAIGLAYSNLDRLDLALDYYNEALDIHRKNGPLLEVADDLCDIGVVYDRMDAYDKALSFFEESLRVSKESGNTFTENTSLKNIAVMYNKLGLHEKAASFLEDAIKAEGTIESDVHKAWKLNEIGNSYYQMGRYDVALPLYLDALRIAQGTGERDLESVVLSNLGNTYGDLEEKGKALDYYGKSLKIYGEIGDRKATIKTLVGIGDVYMDEGWLSIGPLKIGPFNKALGYYEEALTIDREFGDRFQEEWILRKIGNVYNNVEQYEKALTYFGESLKINREIRYVAGIYYSAKGRAKAYRNLGKKNEAIDSYMISIDALEKIRGELTREEHKASFIGAKMKVYEELIELLIEMKRDDEAFNYLERSRSRAFLDMLGTRNLYVAGKLDEELLHTEEELRLYIAGLREKTIEKSAALGTDRTRAAVESTSREIIEAEKKYGELIKEMGARNPELATLVTVSPLELDEVKKLIGPDVRIIEFFTSKRNVFVFLVSKERCAVFTIPIPSDDLLGRLVRFRGGIKDALMMKDILEIQRQSKELYDLLVAGALQDMDEVKLIIVPHGPLHYLPFSALYDGEKYLIDRYTLVVDPSASVLRYILDKRKGVKGNTIAFGNPKTEFSNLPLAETEVTEIEAIMGNVDTYVKDKATETLGKERFGGYNVIHLACHGSFNETEPLMSSVHLARDDKNDGSLMVYELFGLDLTKSSLVVLSACDTGMSKVMTGDELIGLSRGFIFAGTPSLLATLWEVDDRSTADLMAEFYGNLKAGMTKPEALRRAQLHLKSQKGYESPYYWAPFEMIGDWQ